MNEAAVSAPKSRRTLIAGLLLVVMLGGAGTMSVRPTVPGDNVRTSSAAGGSTWGPDVMALAATCPPDHDLGKDSWRCGVWA